MVLDFVPGLTILSSVCIFIESIITNYIITFACFDDKKEPKSSLSPRITCDLIICVWPVAFKCDIDAITAVTSIRLNHMR